MRVVLSIEVLFLPLIYHTKAPDGLLSLYLNTIIIIILAVVEVLLKTERSFLITLILMNNAWLDSSLSISTALYLSLSPLSDHRQTGEAWVIWDSSLTPCQITDSVGDWGNVG